MGYDLDHKCIVEFQGITKRGDNKFIVMKIGSPTSVELAYVGSKDASHDEFLANLPPTEPRFVVYEFGWEGGSKKMLLFILWCDHHFDAS